MPGHVFTEKEKQRVSERRQRAWDIQKARVEAGDTVMAMAALGGTDKAVADEARARAREFSRQFPDEPLAIRLAPPSVAS